MRNNYECLVKGHENCKPSRICVYEKCNLHSRWCCAECVLAKIHLHGLSNINHIRINKSSSSKFITNSNSTITIYSIINIYS